MSGVNKVILLGRLGSDPETKVLTSGSTVTRFSVATSDTWKDKDGNKQEKTEWSNCVAWQKQAEVIAEHMKKGDQIYLEGKLETRSWEDDKGAKRYATDIKVTNFQFVGGKKTSEASQESEQENQEELGF